MPAQFAVSAEPRAFEEALRWFRERFPLTVELIENLAEYAGQRAWTVAEVAQLDLVLEAHAAIANAIEQSWDRKKLGKRLREIFTDFSEHRCETIARTNVQKAYMAGRWEQLEDPDITDVFPYRRVDAILDGRTSEICREYDGITLPWNDPWWINHWSPYHHRCRTTIRAVDEDDYESTPRHKREPTTITPAKTFGESPRTEQPWQPQPNKYPRQLWEAFQRKQVEQERKAANQ